MEAETVLEGCEIICFEGQSSDYVACPLPKEEQTVCKQRRQYEAGRKEVVDFVGERATLSRRKVGRFIGEEHIEVFIGWRIPLEEWQAFLLKEVKK